MAPEIFKKSGHGKPVDAWAIGVISYFLLAGYTPFDRDSTAEEMRAIVHGEYAFEPEVYWAGVSDSALDFINRLLTVDPASRMTPAQALDHPWLATDAARVQGEQKDLLPDIKSAFNAKRTFRKAVHGIRLINRLRSETHENVNKAEIEALRRQIRESEDEHPGEVLDVELDGSSTNGGRDSQPQQSKQQQQQ